MGAVLPRGDVMKVALANKGVPDGHHTLRPSGDAHLLPETQVICKVVYSAH